MDKLDGKSMNIVNDNIEKLEKYLIGEKGYLVNSISDNKIIMLSGKWGSGKTHFWINKIIKKLNDNENIIPNHYISLYGKTSIQEIKNEIFIKIFESVDNSEIEDKSIEVAKHTVDLVSSFTKSINVFGISVDLSKITDKSFENLDKIFKDKKLIKTENYLNSSAIICIDDFERKSKNIDLNDLFGFITQLTLNYKCKVVIILNDDIFKGEERKIFINVKEKSVNKFLQFNPSIDNLFEIIFKECKVDNKYKNIILQSIKDMNVLNARIYENILNNFKEYYLNNNNNIPNDEVKYFVLTIINFNLNHIVFKFYNYRINGIVKVKFPSNFIYMDFSIDFLNILDRRVIQNSQQINTKLELLDIIKSSIVNDYKNRENNKEDNIHILPTEKLDKDIEQVNKYANLIWYFWLIEVQLKYRQNISEEKQKEINDFIDTGIL
jgi:hypothetical protein